MALAFVDVLVVLCLRKLRRKTNKYWIELSRLNR